ncbi:MucB/RseB C-terminal domain-containing protein [Wenzhouxiangella marina]|uniref:Uncharacterized protein n=1 Tax=Wenzhouxiangella marina TaxID=1579979 RepID=A0A0K0XXL8_9GAMM|nr:MucB/RseB C-terminal domain-containing protein [Wenzhouxiangella marina]AKS42444.1 hypothetical protein WM2015_2079 [Wenzhouxiangella marina]MBB6085781.1 sigma-E factor negative regulatory protein RseB [Wenzhouxiangella marina]
MTAVRLSFRSVLILLLLAVLRPASAEDDGSIDHWLDRMARAVETLDYRGTLVHWRGDRVDTLKIIHRADADGVRERLYSLSGPPREILRQGDQVRCLLAGDQPLVVQSQLTARLMPNLPLSRLGTLEQAYDMRLGERERVAGLQTRIIEIRPNDRYRYGHRFWLEEQTGMLLRSALLSASGQPIQQLAFVDIELGARISDAELEPEIEPEVVMETRMVMNLPAVDSSELGEAAWMPRRVPSHFRLARKARGQSADGEPFEHLLFSDGLASFSVYVEEGMQGYTGSRLESIGSVHIFTGLTDGRQITVVGEVPVATLEYVGRSIRRTPGAPRRR